MMRAMSLFLLGLGLASDAGAQMPMANHEERCPTTPAPPPPELTGWSNPVPIIAATDEQALSNAQIAIGQSGRISLANMPDVHYPLRPEKPGGSVSRGGLIGFSIREAGTYRVALGSGPWIDVVRGGRAIPSTAHGHGPACTGVRKMVDFPLKPGRYTLQIAGSGQPDLTLLIAKLR